MAFLSDPIIFQNNPSQYTTLFEFLGVTLNGQTLKDLKDVSIKAYSKYLKYNNKSLKSELSTTVQVIEWNSINPKENEWTSLVNLENGLKWAKVSESEAIRKFASELASANKLNWEIRKILPSWEQERIDQFIRNNQNLITNSPNESVRSLSDERSKNIYLESLYYLEFGWEIRQRISEQYRWNPSEQTRILKQFDENIGKLQQLGFIRPVSWVSTAIDGNFPPTRPTETARVQAEKYEKTHDVYRDGTSLYFVNKNDPKDMKKIEIYADRAVLTVMQGGLSLSRDMTLLSREETEERKEIRKTEGISQEKSREVATIWWAFFQMRGGEYATIPWGDRNIVDILKSRPSWSIQAQYEIYEQLLATKSSEELAKESDASKQSRWAIIDKMLDLSGELYGDNQPYFALWAFWEEKILNEADQVKTKLEERISWLKKFKNSINASEKVSSDLTKLRGAFNPGDKIDTNAWEERVRSYLKEITWDRIGLDGLTDESFQAILSQLEKRDEGGWIWKTGISLGQDATLRDNQQRELRSLSQKVGGREGWQRIEKQIRIDGTLANRAFKWENGQFQKWIESVEKPKSSTP